MFRSISWFWIFWGVTLSLVLPLCGSAISMMLIPLLRFEHVPIHSLLESAGGLMAISIAGILIVEQTRKREATHYPWMAAALIGMGVLDLFHAAVSPGVNFVWLHSIATTVGGLLFAFVWVDSSQLNPKIVSRLPWFVLVLVMILGMASCLFPGQLPPMVIEGGFTRLARALNMLGGFGFLMAGAFFIHRFHTRWNHEDWLFAVHTVLFGGAALLFELSSLWDSAWWWWHILRLCAYLAALSFAIRAYLDAEQAMRKTNRQMNADLDVAVALQERLYPRVAPCHPGFEIAGHVFPSKKGCGDYFDFFPLPSGEMGVAVADVSGHGIGPAMVMVEIRTLLHQLMRTHTDVGTIIEELNRVITNDVPETTFVTLFLAILDCRLGTVRYLGAGHSGMILRRSGACEFLSSTTYPLGISEQVDSHGQATSISTGDVVVLLTDGLTETHSPDQKLFGTNRVVELVRTMRDQPATAIVHELYRASREFSEDLPQQDDIAVVVLKCADESVVHDGRENGQALMKGVKSL